MKTVSMSGSLRESVGKKDAKKTRKEGRIPSVLYGGEKQIVFSIPEVEFKKILYTPEVQLINIDIAGSKKRAILQDIQYHPVSDNILSADFLEVVDSKPITVSVPIRITGVSKGVLRGGKLIKKFKKLKVKGLAEFIPEYIDIDITPLNINDMIKVGQMNIPNLTFLDIPNAVIVSVASTRGVVAAAEEE